MPKWGLTEAQRESRPWGLEPKFLVPAKVITDPIHGDVFITELERIFVDTEPVQRLRRIKQLGNTHLVYPGATHSRFAHSLGAIRVAQDLMDAVLDQRNTPKPQRDLFAEWEEERQRAVEAVLDRAKPLGSGLLELAEDDVETLEAATRGLDLRIAEAVVAVRLGALLHDLCHIPFGHSLEDDLGILAAHDKNEARFERMWARLRLRKDLDQQLRSGGLYQELRRLILSKVPGQPAFRYPFVEDIVGNTICADLLDYLERDHRTMGLPVALGRRFVSAFYVMPTGDPDLGQHMVLKITRPDGRERTDVVTEVLKYLRYRYELSERGLVHHAKLAADAMTGKALEIWFDMLWVGAAIEFRFELHEKARKSAAAFRTPPWLHDDNIGEVRRRFESEHGEEARLEVDARAREDLDDRLSRRGDDALLEELSAIQDAPRNPGRGEAVRALTRGLLNRRLYKQIGTQNRVSKAPRKMVEEYGTPDKRRELEEDAARWAGLKHRWQVLLWLPPHEMRLKIADVLVDAGEAGIMSFVEYERRGRGRGTDIYEAHRALWSIGVYIHPDYADDDLAVGKVLARLAKRVNITFTQFEPELGKQAHLWPDKLAARTLVNKVLGPNGAERRNDLVDELMEYVRGQQVQARGLSDNESWAALYSRYQGAAAAIDELSA